MAYKVIILYQLYMPSYFLGTFTEYPSYTFRSGEGEIQIHDIGQVHGNGHGP